MAALKTVFAGGIGVTGARAVAGRQTDQLAVDMP
jgi:hypothetical protein